MFSEFQISKMYQDTTLVKFHFLWLSCEKTIVLDPPYFETKTKNVFRKNTPSSSKQRKFWICEMLRYAKYYFVKYASIFFVKVFLHEKQCDQVNIWAILGTVPKNDPKSIGICPGTLISHFGIIKTAKFNKIQLKHKEHSKTFHNFHPQFPERRPISK